MKNAQKPDHTSLSTILAWLREGRYVVPDFQREFEWQPWDILDLTRSIFLDYFIGSLLLWEGKKENYEALSCESIYGYTGAGHPTYIVLDGQQRLTAMYYAFVAPKVKLPNRANRAIYYVKVDLFMNQEYDRAFSYDWASKRIDTLLQDREAQYAQHFFPCSVIGSGGFELPNWLQGYAQYWRNQVDLAAGQGDDDAVEAARLHADNAQIFSNQLAELVQQYQVSYISLDQDLGLEKVCDIFTQLNSKGVRLDVFDLMNALLKPKGLQLKHIWREAAPSLEFVETPKMNVYVLQVMSILKQAYCSPRYLYYLLPGEKKKVRDAEDGTLREDILVGTSGEFKQLWQVSVGALQNAISMLRHPHEFGVTSSKYLPYVAILPVFSALQHHLKSLPQELRFSGQRKIRHWYWAAVFTNRYSGSVESTSAQDYLGVSRWIRNESAEPAMIAEFKNNFRNLNMRAETNSGSSLYNGVFNLLVIAGARDWITGTIPPHNDLDDHHIIPSSWGKNLKGKEIHTILNRTPLTAETNREVIGSDLPNVYLPKMIAQNGEETVRQTLATHFISSTAFDILLRNPFTPADFEDFIKERQRTIQDAIEDLLIKERLDLPPRLRELDAAVESIERGLRQIIQTSLDGNSTLLPSHVTTKANERIQRAAHKNAAFNSKGYETLVGKLEYADMRELQDTILSKPLWPRFEARFVNKESTATKFDQLSELRNCLSHSRTIDDITRKEGEAAILWFQHVLKSPASELQV